MSSEDYDEKIDEESNKQKKIGKQLDKTHGNIIKTVKDRKRVEMEYLDTVKKQMRYWKSQIDNTDPKKDKDRYNELKKNIERERTHIKQIQDEVDRINKEIKMEEEHKDK